MAKKRKKTITVPTAPQPYVTLPDLYEPVSRPGEWCEYKPLPCTCNGQCNRRGK